MKIGTRDRDIIRMLIRYPLTAEQLLRASLSFERPYTNATQLKADLLDLFRRGILNREPIPSTTRGQKQYYYFLKRKARLILPEVAEIAPRSAVFRGFTESPWHTLATSDFMSHFERSAGELKDRVRVVVPIRPRYFRAKVQVDGPNGLEIVAIEPDYTQVVRFDGEANLFFVEIVNHTAIINPLASQSVTRSFRFKMSKYKALQKVFRGHHIIRSIERSYQCRFKGFRVLVVTTKGEENKHNLLACAKGQGFRKMFYFATMKEVAEGNLFADPVWSLPSGSKRGLLD